MSLKDNTLQPGEDKSWFTTTKFSIATQYSLGFIYSCCYFHLKSFEGGSWVSRLEHRQWSCAVKGECHRFEPRISKCVLFISQSTFYCMSVHSIILFVSSSLWSRTGELNKNQWLKVFKVPMWNKYSKDRIKMKYT